jgi:hypothetical protein
MAGVIIMVNDQSVPEIPWRMAVWCYEGIFNRMENKTLNFFGDMQEWHSNGGLWGAPGRYNGGSL